MASLSTTGMILMIFLQLFSFLFVISLNDINPDAHFGTPSGNVIQDFDEGGGSNRLLDTSDVSGNLPSSAGSLDASTGLQYTDTFGSLKSWFLKLPGINYAYSFLAAPYNLLKWSGLPNDFVFAIGSFWYLLFLLLFVLNLVGRD